MLQMNQPQAYFHIFQMFVQHFEHETGKPTKNASTRRTGSTMWLDLPSSRFCLSPSLLNEQQERFFSISASLSGAPSLEAIKNSQTVGNCQLTKLFSQQQRQGGRRGAGEVAGGGTEGGLQSLVWFVFFFSHRQT